MVLRGIVILLLVCKRTVKHLIDRLSEQEPSPDEHPNDGASNDEDLERLLGKIFNPTSGCLVAGAVDQTQSLD
ncbi:MAG: hypothetical protein CM15mP82_5020 [Methanobacteriota archaeon]|nr:MAG: hypothetical protein CM15mP82_5020 [Euryarchaeota archaeon]